MTLRGDKAEHYPQTHVPHDDNDEEKGKTQRDERDRVCCEQEEKPADDAHSRHCEEVFIKGRRLPVVIVVTQGRLCACSLVSCVQSEQNYMGIGSKTMGTTRCSMACSMAWCSKGYGTCGARLPGVILSKCTW